MNKSVFYIIVILICIGCIESCVNSCKESNREKLEADIRSACEKGDYVKAYKLVNKIESGYDHKKEQFYSYVATQEAIFLMTEGYYDRVKSLYQQTRSAIGYDYSIDSFNEIVLGQAITEDRYDFILEYISIAGIYNEDIEEKIIEKLETYFISKNTPEANGYVLKSINNKKIDSLWKEYHTLPLVGETNPFHISHYRKFAAEANLHYLEAITKALYYKNTSLANDILSFFKKDIIIDENEAVTKIIQSNEELEAIQKVQQALQSNQ